MKNRTKRITLLGFLLLVTPAISQSFNYNVLESHVSFIPQADADISWTIGGDCDNTITFHAEDVPVTVGDDTKFSAATVTILYEVDSSECYPVEMIQMSLTGTVADQGRILWAEVVEDLNGNVLGTGTGSILGSFYSGGSDGDFSINTSIALSSPVSHYKVKKSFFLDIAGDPPPSDSVAALYHIEQTGVPEPATIASFGIGIALLFKRRKK
ncbi:MAG TPA: PEP-CTERM sorting domain-containing protein [Fimbriimonadales bacterium]|nr:PEP-CTERM sorting domain-containing protein [Fimbriimonadales bacterium]